MMPFSMSKALFVPLSKGCLGVYQLCPSNRAIFVKEESVRRLFLEMESDYFGMEIVNFWKLLQFLWNIR